MNDRLLKLRRIEEMAWAFIKAELFYVDGDCQNSGHCCRSIMIYSELKPILSVEDWVKYATGKQHLQRFAPVTNGQSITHYDCDCLTPESMCREYDSRPNFCRLYPFSNFMNDQPFSTGCGYFVAKTQLDPGIKYKKLRNFVSAFYDIYM